MGFTFDRTSANGHNNHVKFDNNNSTGMNSNTLAEGEDKFRHVGFCATKTSQPETVHSNYVSGNKIKMNL